MAVCSKRTGKSENYLLLNVHSSGTKVMFVGVTTVRNVRRRKHVDRGKVERNEMACFVTNENVK
jgi:hypothetical protein